MNKLHIEQVTHGIDLFIYFDKIQNTMYGHKEDYCGTKDILKKKEKPDYTLPIRLKTGQALENIIPYKITETRSICQKMLVI